MNNEKFSILMYFMTKEIAKYGFSDFLKSHYVTEEEWRQIKKFLKDNFDVKTYC